MITNSVLTTSNFEFTPNPATCGITYTVEWLTPLPDPSLITLNQVAQTFTIEGTDISFVGDYDIKVTAVSNLGVLNSESFTFTVTVTIGNPC